MIPKSVSASSLKVAEGCLSRYKFEYIDYARQPAGSAAQIGTTVHATLENLLRAVFITKTAEWSNELAFKLYNQAYLDTFGPDITREEYQDGWNLVISWMNEDGRLDYLRSVRVASLEAKNSFPVKVKSWDGNKWVEIEIPVNYIMDRVDVLPNGDIRVVDYKTGRIPLSEEELHENIQARLYALAVQIMYPKAERVWVQFDFLRSKAVEIGFTRNDNKVTWKVIKAAVQRIVNTTEAEAERAETLNSECLFCVRKASCKALAGNVAAGGIFGMETEDQARRFADIKNQIKALSVLQAELEQSLLAHLTKAEVPYLDLGPAAIKLKQSSRRSADPREVVKLIGDELAAEIGSFTIASLEALAKSGKLSPDKANALRALMIAKKGELSIEVIVKKGP